jgi:hypothetical protein
MDSLGRPVTLNKHGVECRLADPCHSCQHGLDHSPLLAVYDPDSGRYAIAADPVCMARWATANRRHDEDSICGRPAFRNASEFDLCEHHYNRVLEYRYFDVPLDQAGEKLARLRDADARYAAAQQESQEHCEAVRAKASVVYYIRRMSDGMIKIGTSTTPAKRIATHRREQGEIQILLMHSGGRKEEQEVHRKLDVYRPGRSEWFHSSRPLLRWILETRQLGRHNGAQGMDLLTLTEFRKLVRNTSPDDYCWRNGRLVPKRKATAA